VRPRYGSAKAIGISLGSVQRIWRAYKLQPHRLRTFKRSRDPSFATKLTDIVGLDVIGRPTLWCSCSDERARSKLSTAPGLDYRSSPLQAGEIFGISAAKALIRVSAIKASSHAGSGCQLRPGRWNVRPADDR
jgi:hypothetical protein